MKRNCWSNWVWENDTHPLITQLRDGHDTVVSEEGGIYLKAKSSY